MTESFAARANARTLPMTALTADKFDQWLKKQPKPTAAWVRSAGFAAAPGSVLLLPGKDGGAAAGALVGVSGDGDIWSWAAAGDRLPRGRYRLAREPKAAVANRIALGWGLAGYGFTRYKGKPKPRAELVWPKQADKAAVEGAVAGTTLTRDLINTPASDMGPAELADAARALARTHKAVCGTVVGDDLLKKNFPAIHAVGRASDRAPRLIDLKWGRTSDPRITLVGKGVCFDTGGLDLKGAAGMLLMKKDMGGAAHVLGLAHMIMAAKLKVRLRVLIPAVENAVSGNAYRPMDVIPTRKGLTVEIGNTDAEGRVVMSDALALAAAEKPALILDFATLTGAARIALGPSLPAMFANDDRLAERFAKAGAAADDPVWRMPLWQPYRKYIEPNIADISNTGKIPQGGAITAALFLESFVEPDIPWAHFDIMAWNSSGTPGKPEGGEAMGLRAAFEVIAKHYAK